MPMIKVDKPFPFSPDGKSVIEIEAGEQEVSDRCAEVAVDHLKVATRVGGKGKSPGQNSKAGEQKPEQPEQKPSPDAE